MRETNEGRVGLVIAGGRSRRFGGEKAAALLHGRSLAAWAHERLAAACRAVALNAAPDSAAAAEAARRGGTVVADPPGLPAGPLAGILAGLLWAQETGAGLLLALPCDTPLVPGDLAQRLIAAAAERPCAVARTPDGIHSLCAAWRTELIAPLRARLEAGEHPPVHAFLQAHGCGFADYPDATGFLNVNTPQDLAEAERRLAAAS